MFRKRAGKNIITMVETSVIAGISAAIVSFALGYSIAKIANKSSSDSSSKRPKNPATTTAHDEASDKMFEGMGDEYKMVLVVRNDLKMGKGKIAAQCGHAAVGAFETGVQKTPALIKKWRNSGQAKIAVKVESEAVMMEIYQTARANKLNCCLIRDAGRTQIEPNTKTVLAIGPAPVAALDSVTGQLKLL
uniref:peptidyl-tRNA hydrolase n=1 Tax=Anopheles farauti TaxID=69004 RepID=A0A182QSL9_9DIPT